MGTKLTSSREFNKIIKEMIDRGWTVVQSKQIKLICPEGGFVSISRSPSCPFAHRKVLMDIRRLEKKNKLKKQEAA